MPRRRKRNESELEALLKAPWQLSAGLAAAILVLSQTIIPLLFGANHFTTILVPVVKTFGFIASIALGAISLALYFKQRTKPFESTQGAPRNSYFDSTNVTAALRPDATHNAWEESLSASRNNITSNTSKPTEWSSELLRQIEWKRVEELVAAYFREKTFRTETIAAGPDGGIDIKLFSKDKDAPFAVVQCKAWNTQKVGVKPIRELLGVMSHEKVAKGIFFTTGEFTQEAVAFAKENPINLITGNMLFKGILALSDAAKHRLLAVATEGDYTTPTCTSCGVKLVRRESKNRGFWGCRNYPRCKTKIFAN